MCAHTRTERPAANKTKCEEGSFQKGPAGMYRTFRSTNQKENTMNIRVGIYESIGGSGCSIVIGLQWLDGLSRNGLLPAQMWSMYLRGMIKSTLCFPVAAVTRLFYTGSLHARQRRSPVDRPILELRLPGCAMHGGVSSVVDRTRRLQMMMMPTSRPH